MCPKKLISGCKEVFSRHQKLISGCKKLFLGYRLFFAGNRSLWLTKIPKHHTNYENIKKIKKCSIWSRKKNNGKQTIFLVGFCFDLFFHVSDNISPNNRFLAFFLQNRIVPKLLRTISTTLANGFFGTICLPRTTCAGPFCCDPSIPRLFSHFWSVAANCARLGFTGCRVKSRQEQFAHLPPSLSPQDFRKRELPIVANFACISIEKPRTQQRSPIVLGLLFLLFVKRFCKSRCIFISSLSSRIESMEYVNWGAAPFVHSGEKWKDRTRWRSEMPVWTVSQRFSHLQWRRLFKELWGRPTTADFGSPLWQVPYTSDVCLLDDKVQERCTCSQFPTETMQWIKEVELVDSVDELRSSSSTRGISMPNFELLDARIASALNRIIHNSHFKKRINSRGSKDPERDPFPSWKTDCLLDPRVLPGHWEPWFCRELCRPIH